MRGIGVFEYRTSKLMGWVEPSEEGDSLEHWLDLGVDVYGRVLGLSGRNYRGRDWNMFVASWRAEQHDY